MEQCQLIKLARLGDKEAAQRLTDAGVLVPCPGCGADEFGIRTSEGYWCWCSKCGWSGPLKMNEYDARLAWNTRAPILSAEEMEMLK